MPDPTLVWSEEFDSLDLASGRNPGGLWRPNDVWQNVDEGYLDFGSGGKSSWNCAPEQSLGGTRYNPFSVKDSVLTIRSMRTPDAARDDAHGADWLTGILISNFERVRFTYGYFEFKMRLHQQRGGFPALWFYSRDGGTGPRFGAEIDVFEVFGHPGGRPWYSTLHSSAEGVLGIGSQEVLTSFANSARWHTYGLFWAPDRLEFYFDRKRIGAAMPSFVEWYRDCEMDIRINVAMDADWFPPQHKSWMWTKSVRMELDYIRQYNMVPPHGT